MEYLILFTILILIPPVCGLLPLHFMKEEHRSLLAAYVIGWITMFALFELVAIPFIQMRASFHRMADCYSIVLLIVFAAGIVLGRKTALEIVKGLHGQAKKNKWEIIGWILVIVLTVTQVVFLVFYQYIDGDDAYYVAVSVDSLAKDTMYVTSAYDGYPYADIEIRHALSPVPLFIAWIAKYTEIHPTILAHSVIGPAFMGLMYMIYTLLGRRLFHDKKQWVPAFVLLVMAFYIFGHVSIYTAETFAYTRTWQGKSMLPNLIMPMCYLALLYLAEEKRKLGEWILLFMLMLAAVFCTSVSVFFMAVLLTAAGLLFWLREKKTSVLAGFGVCLLPCLVFGVLYLIQ